MKIEDENQKVESFIFSCLAVDTCLIKSNQVKSKQTTTTKQFHFLLFDDTRATSLTKHESKIVSFTKNKTEYGVVVGIFSSTYLLRVHKACHTGLISWIKLRRSH